MIINFATCDRQQALGFLRQLYASRDFEDEGNTKALLDLVEADNVRIQDPNIYGSRVGVIPGTHWDESRRQEIFDVCKKFHEEQTA